MMLTIDDHRAIHDAREIESVGAIKASRKGDAAHRLAAQTEHVEVDLASHRTGHAQESIDRAIARVVLWGRQPKTSMLI